MCRRVFRGFSSCVDQIARFLVAGPTRKSGILVPHARLGGERGLDEEAMAKYVDMAVEAQRYKLNDCCDVTGMPVHMLLLQQAQ